MIRVQIIVENSTAENILCVIYNKYYHFYTLATSVIVIALLMYSFLGRSIARRGEKTQLCNLDNHCLYVVKASCLRPDSMSTER